MHGLFSTELTPEERQFGFSVIEFKNPRSQIFGGQPEKISAVAKLIGKSDRIIKTNSPDGGCTFKHQRYGYLSNDRFRDHVDWLPVGVAVYTSASHAVQMIESGIAEESQTDTPSIIPVDPSEN